MHTLFYLRDILKTMSVDVGRKEEVLWLINNNEKISNNKQKNLNN